MSMYTKWYTKAEGVFASLPSESREMVLQYIKHQIHRQLSPQTVRSTIEVLKDFFAHCAKDRIVDLSRMEKGDVRQYLEALVQRGLSAGSINTYLRRCRSFFAYLVEEDVLLKNPVLKRYHVEEANPLPRPMEKGDLEVFLKHLQHPFDKAVFLLMLRCGLRVGEVCRLRKSDIGWEKQNLIVYNGKGKVDRVVYISKDAQKALRQWLENSDSSSSYCFFSQYKRGEAPISPDMIRSKMKKIVEESGLKNKGYGPHTLRHTFATTLLNAGLELYILKELMGHKKLNQTLMYAKLYDETVRSSYYRAMQRLEEEGPVFQEGGRISYLGEAFNK